MEEGDDEGDEDESLVGPAHTTQPESDGVDGDIQQSSPFHTSHHDNTAGHDEDDDDDNDNYDDSQL